MVVLVNKDLILFIVVFYFIILRFVYKFRYVIFNVFVENVVRK